MKYTNPILRHFIESFKLLKMLSFLFSLLFATIVGAQPGSDYRYISIKDQSHNYVLAAGVQANNNVYHQKPDNRDVAQWQFIPAGNGFYHIIDRSHGLALVAGFNADNNVYHQKPDGPHGMWRLKPMGNNTFQIFDAKHNKALVAGDVKNNGVYHQDPRNRSNSIWKLEVVDGSGKAPKEMKIGEQYLSTVYHWDRVQYLGEPTKVVVEESFKNGTSRLQKSTLEKTTNRTVTETWSFSEEISKTISNSIETSVNAGFKVKVVDIDATVTHNYTNSKTETEGTTKGKTQTSTYTLKLSHSLDVEPGEFGTCRNIFTEQKINLPFTIKSVVLYGDGRSEEVMVSGTWRGNQYFKSEIECNSAPINNASIQPVTNNNTTPNNTEDQPVVSNPPSSNSSLPTGSEYDEEPYEEESYEEEPYEEESYEEESYEEENNVPPLIILEKCSSSEFHNSDGYYFLADNQMYDCNCWNNENERFSIGVIDGIWVIFQGMDCPMNDLDFIERLGIKKTCNPAEVACIRLGE